MKELFIFSTDLTGVLSLVVPYNIQNPDQSLEDKLAGAKVPTSLSVVYDRASPEVIDGLKWALQRGRPVDIDVQVTLTESTLEEFEDVIAKATEGIANPPPIILCAYFD